MHLQARTGGSDEGADFQHVRLQDGTVGAIEVQGIVFEEGAAYALAHDPYGAVERGRLPVTFRAKAIAFGHETL